MHQLGQRSRWALEDARQRVASLLNAEPAEIVFTGGGTESINHGLRGIALAREPRRHMVTSAIEHEAVLETCRSLEQDFGFQVTYVRPGVDGIIDAKAFVDAMRADTAVAALMYANNEIGTLQPVGQVAHECRARGVPLFVDAVQAVGQIPVDVREIQVDALALSAHKFTGPKGTGALYLRNGVGCRPGLRGGPQERQRRAGTENVAGIAGMVAALEESLGSLDTVSPRLAAMRDLLFDRILSACPGSVPNGSRTDRLPGNVNISFPRVDGESMVMALDREGVLVSSGAACASGSTDPSHVLLAMGASEARARGALRVTIGAENTWDEIGQAQAAIVRIADRLGAPEATRGGGSAPAWAAMVTGSKALG